MLAESKWGKCGGVTGGPTARRASWGSPPPVLCAPAGAWCALDSWAGFGLVSRGVWRGMRIGWRVAAVGCHMSACSRLAPDTSRTIPLDKLIPAWYLIL